jgi:hypothetical protein
MLQPGAGKAHRIAIGAAGGEHEQPLTTFQVASVHSILVPSLMPLALDRRWSAAVSTGPFGLAFGDRPPLDFTQQFVDQRLSTVGAAIEAVAVFQLPK